MLSTRPWLSPLLVGSSLGLLASPACGGGCGESGQGNPDQAPAECVAASANACPLGSLTIEASASSDCSGSLDIEADVLLQNGSGNLKGRCIRDGECAYFCDFTESCRYGAESYTASEVVCAANPAAICDIADVADVCPPGSGPRIDSEIEEECSQADPDVGEAIDCRFNGSCLFACEVLTGHCECGVESITQEGVFCSPCVVCNQGVTRCSEDGAGTETCAPGGTTWVYTPCGGDELCAGPAGEVACHTCACDEIGACCDGCDAVADGTPCQDGDPATFSECDVGTCAATWDGAIHGHGTSLFTIGFAPDGVSLVSTAFDGTKVWDRTNGAALGELAFTDTLEAAQSLSAKFLGGDDLFTFSVTQDSAVWDYTNPAQDPLRLFRPDGVNPTVWAAPTADGTHAGFLYCETTATPPLCETAGVYFVDLSSGDVVPDSTSIIGHPLLSIEFSPDGNRALGRAAFSADEPEVGLYSLTFDSATLSLASAGSSTAQLSGFPVFSPQGSTVATPVHGPGEAGIELRTAASIQTVAETIPLDAAPIRLAYNSDGTRLGVLTCDEDFEICDVRVFSTNTLSEVFRLDDFPTGLTGLAFNESGDLLAVGRTDGFIHVLDVSELDD